MGPRGRSMEDETVRKELLRTWKMKFMLTSDLEYDIAIPTLK